MDSTQKKKRKKKKIKSHKINGLFKKKMFLSNKKTNSSIILPIFDRTKEGRMVVQ